MRTERDCADQSRTTRCGKCGTIDGCACTSEPKPKKCRKCGGRGYRRIDVGSSLDRTVRCECRPDNRFYREAPAVPHAGSTGSYRDEFNTTADYDNGYRSAVRLARVLMEKHFPEATGWSPAPDLLGVITQLDHITAHLFGCFAGAGPEPAFVPACTCHPDDRGREDCPRKHAASDCHVARHPVRDRFSNDEAAKALYDTWANKPGWVPWVERGNSTMQERARREVTL